MPPVQGSEVPVARPNIPPRRPRAGPPQDPVDHLPVVVPPASPARRPVGQERLQPCPLCIGQIVTIEHRSGLPGPRLKIGERRPSPLRLEVTLTLGEEVLGEVSCVVRQEVTQIDIAVPAVRNGQDRARLLWAPEHPHLVDAEVVLRDRDSGQPVDTVASYLGLREVSVGGGSFNLNGQPYYTRSVLNQGYRPETHLASRGSDELRAEVELIKAMGFNAVRIHQKAEDPRFLFWADRLGLLVWGETAGAYEFSPRAIALLTTEWMEIVRRYRSHPSVVVWYPSMRAGGCRTLPRSRLNNSSRSPS